jgi:hypothetical protein
MLRPGKARSPRPATLPTNNFDLRLDENDIFEIDRSDLILQLHTIRRAINESAEEMEMVAIERVFVKSVSQALTLTARKLYRVAEELNALHRIVARAHLPKAERFNPKSRSRPRPKRRN